MSKTRILVTGASGQLGQCLKARTPNALKDQVLWTDLDTLDITDSLAVKKIFNESEFDYCINTAAYTAVDKAESESTEAFNLNATAVRELAQQCKQHKTVLIHLSTDYVFDGKAEHPYDEDHKPAPVNVYGASKAAGEVAVRALLKEHFIIRASWLYSPYGHNFYRSIKSKLQAGDELTVTTDQTGTPTNGIDLADFIWKLVVEEKTEFGTYHYSNTGAASWYEFARTIAKILGKNYENQLASTTHYATFAARPAYSVLSKEKIKAVFDVQPPDWKESLHQLMNHD